MSNGNGSVQLPEITVTAPAPAAPVSAPTPSPQVPPLPQNPPSMRPAQGLPTQIPYPPEIAEVSVSGIVSSTWESVMVQINYAEAWPIFKFQTAEGQNQDVQGGGVAPMYMPGQYVQITLGGQLAVTGIIVKRETAYDAQHHQVQFEGYGVTWLAARASHVDKSDSGQSGNFDGMSFIQAAAAVLAPFAGDGVGYTVVGSLDPTPFKRLQIEPGETIWNFLERIARPRGVVVGTDPKGNFIFTGYHSVPAGDALVEGLNIKSCNAILSIDGIYSEYDVRGQTAGDDSNNGAQAAEQQGYFGGALGAYSARSYSPNLTPAEQPVWGQPELQDRAKHEHEWHDYTYAQAVVTVYGWLQQNGLLWQAGQGVMLYSPMIPFNQIMAVQRVTFTQDSQRGTLTTLDLVLPGLLQGTSEFNVANGVPDISDTPAPQPPQPQYQQGQAPTPNSIVQGAFDALTPPANPFAGVTD